MKRMIRCEVMFRPYGRGWGPQRVWGSEPGVKHPRYTEACPRLANSLTLVIVSLNSGVLAYPHVTPTGGVVPKEDIMGFDYAGKIRALLAHAEDEALSDEARASYRAKAMQFMRDYQIAEEEALAVDPTSAVPITVVIDMSAPNWDLRAHYPTMMQRIANHTGVRVHAQTGVDYKSWRFTLVGYEGDIRYTEFLWTAAYLMFSTRIDPVWDDSLSEAENIYRLRQAGWKRKDIADRAYGSGAGEEAKNRSKVQRIYRQEVAKRGEDAIASGLSFNAQNYRQAYADQFIQTLTRRMMQARDAVDSVGGGMVLHGRKARVDEAFYEVFPKLRPSTDPVPAPKPCDACAKAKSGHCRQHPAYTWTKADQARWERQQYSSSARAGRAAGSSAAAGVNLTRGTARTSRIEPSGRSIEG